MKIDMKRFRNYIVTSLAVSMLIVFWMFCIDAFFNGLWNNFRIIISIVLFAFLLCGIEILINNILDNRPVISMILEYAVVVILFFIFGKQFRWYHQGMEWIVFIYTIPVYAVGYLLKLIGAKKDAEYINNKLTQRKKRKNL